MIGKHSDLWVHSQAMARTFTSLWLLQCLGLITETHACQVSATHCIMSLTPLFMVSFMDYVIWKFCNIYICIYIYSVYSLPNISLLLSHFYEFLTRFINFEQSIFCNYTLHILAVVVNAFNPCTQEVEAGWTLCVWGQTHLQSKFLDRQGYTRKFSLENSKEKNKQTTTTQSSTNKHPYHNYTLISLVVFINLNTYICLYVI